MKSLELNQEFLNFLLKSFDLRLELRAFVSSDGTGDDLSGDTTGATQCVLRFYENIGNVLVFAQKWQMQKNLKGFGVGRHHYQFGQISIQCFCGFLLIINYLSINQ